MARLSDVVRRTVATIAVGAVVVIATLSGAHAAGLAGGGDGNWRITAAAELPLDN